MHTFGTLLGQTNKLEKRIFLTLRAFKFMTLATNNLKLSVQRDKVVNAITLRIK